MYSNSEEFNASHHIDIDSINKCLADSCYDLTHLGIFYRQSELKFRRDSLTEYVFFFLLTHYLKR